MLEDVSIDALQAAMHGLSARQRAISADIANVNTPFYRAHDVAFEADLQRALDGGNPFGVECLVPHRGRELGGELRLGGGDDVVLDVGERARGGLHGLGGRRLVELLQVGQAVGDRTGEVVAAARRGGTGRRLRAAARTREAAHLAGSRTTGVARDLAAVQLRELLKAAHAADPADRADPHQPRPICRAAW